MKASKISLYMAEPIMVFVFLCFKERELKKQTKEYNKILPKVVSGKSVADFSVLYFYFTFIL